jgi:hypothetical protein
MSTLVKFNASFCPRLALSTSGFSSAPELGKGHRFLEHGRAVIQGQGLVQSFMIVEIEIRRTQPDYQSVARNGPQVSVSSALSVSGFRVATGSATGDIP